MATPYQEAEQWLRANAEVAINYLSPTARLLGNDYVVGDLDGA